LDVAPRKAANVACQTPELNLKIGPFSVGAKGVEAVRATRWPVAFAVTVLVPIAGAVAAYGLARPDNHYGVSFRLLSLYMGLCFVAAAVLVYSLRCPREIKGCSTAPDFIAKFKVQSAGRHSA